MIDLDCLICFGLILLKFTLIQWAIGKCFDFLILAGSAFYEIWTALIISVKMHFLLLSENEFFHEIECNGMTSFMDFMFFVLQESPTQTISFVEVLAKSSRIVNAIIQRLISGWRCKICPSQNACMRLPSCDHASK